MSADIKTWQERVSAEWLSHLAKAGLNPGESAMRAEIADLRVALAAAQSEAFAFREWAEKTEWVQQQISTFPVSALGKHRADVMREEIERLRLRAISNPAPLDDAGIKAALETAGIGTMSFTHQSAGAQVWATSGSTDVRKLARAFEAAHGIVKP